MAFFLNGIIFWLPVVLVLYIALLLFKSLDKIGRNILGFVVPDKYLYVGLGAIFCILIVYFSGILLKKTSISKVLSKIPLLGFFFGQGEIMSVERLSHMAPCLFLHSPTYISYGWIVAEEKVRLSHKQAFFPIINIYCPNVPALVTGHVVAARKDTVMKLANSSLDVIDLLLYNIRCPESLNYVPWEDESIENFEERSKYFGLKLDTGKKSLSLEEIHPV
jgi:uncharacterized membrane protein